MPLGFAAWGFAALLRARHLVNASRYASDARAMVNALVEADVVSDAGSAALSAT